MLKLVRVFALSLLVICMATGCQTTNGGKDAVARPVKKLADAGNKTISILMEPGLEGLQANAAKSRQQISDRMGQDAVRVFHERGGYKAQVITSKDQFQAGPGSYLLSVKITKYNPGSKAARMIVGFGAGSCSLDIHYELLGADQPLLSNNDGVGSSLEWTRLIRKLNENMLVAVNTALAAQATK